MRLHHALNTSVRSPGQVLSNGHFGVSGNGNGHGHRGHGGNGHIQPKAVKVTKRRKPHMKHGLNQAAAHAYGAALLMFKAGFTIAQAIACTGSSTDYIDAMKWIMASGDQDLLDRVLHGQRDIFYVATQVRPLVEMRAAYQKLTPKQRIEWAAAENPNRVFDEVIVPASVVSSTNTKVGFVEMRS